MAKRYKRCNFEVGRRKPEIYRVNKSSARQKCRRKVTESALCWQHTRIVDQLDDEAFALLYTDPTINIRHFNTGG